MPQGVANNNNKNNTQTKYRWTIQMWVYQYFVTSLVAQLVKESACNAGGTDLIPWSGRSPGEGIDYPIQYSFLGFLGELDSKESTCNVGYLGSIPGLERSLGEGNGYPVPYSGLENSKDSIGHGVAESQTRLSDFHCHFLSSLVWERIWERKSYGARDKMFIVNVSVLKPANILALDYYDWGCNKHLDIQIIN